MFLSLSYKEWIKIRWVLLILVIVGFASVLTIFLHLGALSEFNDANSVWSYVIFKQYLFYGDFEYIPVLIGLAIGVAQFFPEISNLRLKLTLHLPEEENKLLFYMLIYGTLVILLLEVILTIFLSIVTSSFFPYEVVLSQFYTLLPWLFAGFVAYFFVASIMVEPLWERRVVLLLFGYSITSYYLITSGYENYNQSIHWFILIAVLEFLLIFLSGFRFKRGAR